MWIDLKKVDAYVQLLLKWNSVYRLTGSHSADVIYDLHVTDALALAPLINKPGAVVDLGSGAGLPGIVLKILRPDLDMILVEPQRKRVNFCEEAIRKLGLSRIRIICGRTDEGTVREGVGAVGTVVSRAVWGLETYVRIAREYLYGNGGDIVCFVSKGLDRSLLTNSNWAADIERIPYSTLLSRREKLLLILHVLG